MTKDESKNINPADLIKEIVQDLLLKLEVNASIDVTQETDENKEENFKVNINTEETGLLIGRHGEIINSLQLLVGVILYKKLNSWYRIILNVGDYREAREESIKQMAERIVAEVETTGAPVVLPYLTPYERRIIHMLLSDRKTVVSESTGEGKDRRLTIRPK
jgi:spoIIIJ-associated protein